MKRFALFSTAALAFIALTTVGCGSQDATPPQLPVPPPPAAVTPTPSETTPTEAAVPAGEVKKFTISPDTTIGWAATVPIGTRTGGWGIFDGTIEVAGDNFETAKISVEVEMASAYSDADELTQKLKGEEHFFNPIKFPKSTFKSTAIKKTATGYDITGDFTIRDVTKSLTFPAEVKIEGNKLTGKAKFDMNRQDFGITYQSAIGDYAIKDLCTLTLDLVAEVQ